jgi:hypothetical protein
MVNDFDSKSFSEKVFKKNKTSIEKYFLLNNHLENIKKNPDEQ